MAQVKIPIALLIGNGSRVRLLLEQVFKKQIPVEIISVISHKALLPDKNGNKTKDVPGIALAKKLGFRTEYFNLVQMRNAAKNVAGKNHQKFDMNKYREKDYFPVLASFISQEYPVSPQAIFMNGWDLVVPKGFLDYFPVINFHPSLLPEKRGEKEVVLSNGQKIPVLIGEETEVLNTALKLKLPAIGVTAHFAQPIADAGGSVIDRIEIPIKPSDNFDSLRKRHIKAESKFMVDVISNWAQGKYEK